MSSSPGLSHLTKLHPCSSGMPRADSNHKLSEVHISSSTPILACCPQDTEVDGSILITCLLKLRMKNLGEELQHSYSIRVLKVILKQRNQPNTEEFIHNVQ